MNISSLRLTNFRNITDLSLEFPYKMIGILGENAQGKTNLLEALYLLSTGVGWRTSIDTEFIQFDQSFARVDGTIGDDQTRLTLTIERSENSTSAKKGYIVNDVRRKKETFISYFPTVLFHPEDLVLITGSPAQRRKVLDEVLIQAFPYYAHLSSQYGKIVVSRNCVLEAIREGNAKVDQLVYWTDMLVKLAAEVYKFRYSFFEFVGTDNSKFTFRYLPKIHSEYLSHDEHFIKHMEKSIHTIIEENPHKEIMSASSQYGPHKDDFEFMHENRDLSLFGSRGEQRAATFAFKKMQLEFVEKIRATKPVLLLDDVFSEFDRPHRAELWNLTLGFQTFISGTEDRFFTEESFNFDKIYKVKNGQILV